LAAIVLLVELAAGQVLVGLGLAFAVGCLYRRRLLKGELKHAAFDGARFVDRCARHQVLRAEMNAGFHTGNGLALAYGELRQLIGTLLGFYSIMFSDESYL